MDQLSQRSSSERTQFMSREDLDQEGSLDLDHDQYHYQDQDQDHYTDQEDDQKPTLGANISPPTKTLELKVPDERTDLKCTEIRLHSCSDFHSSKLYKQITCHC